MTCYRVLSAVVLAAAASSTPLTTTAASAAHVDGWSVSVHRGGPARTFVVDAPHGGEALLRFTTDAPGSDWGTHGAESAVAQVLVDGQPRTNLVVPSATPTRRAIALGALTPGSHRVQVRFDDQASPPLVSQMNLVGIRASVSAPTAADNPVLAHAPVVVGRALPTLGSADQNATTDTPVLAWHEVRDAATPGHRIVEYSVVWSNEDGGTDTPALMARWGRTTDIEWIYRVELDASGKRVPGTDVYQAPSHQTLHFTGTYEAGHPVLQTCTSNNNMCDQVVLPPGQPGLRFLLAADETRPPDRARESLMDAHPWTYPVMAAEMQRENKVEQPGFASTPQMSDQRNYLWLEMRKATGTAATTVSAPGVSIGVRLKGDPTLYRSDHQEPSWSVTRDDPAATTVELPLGTSTSDIASIVALRVSPGSGDNGAPVTVLGVNRAFFLGADRLPQASFLHKDTSLQLTSAQPEATIWSATG